MRRGQSSPARAGPSATSSYRCSPRAAPGSRGAAGNSFAEDSARAPEHHGDKKDERDDVAPLHREEEASDGEELGKDERGDEAAQHVAEPAAHADKERGGPPREADRRRDVVLKDQRASSQSCTPATERGSQREDAPR